MTIQLSREGFVWSKKTKALIVGLLAAAMMAASLMSPTQAEASAFPGANGKIAFASDRTTGAGVNNPEGDPEIFAANPDGTGLKQLTKNNTNDFAPSYSADGKRVVLQSDRTGNFDIFVMNADGTGQKNLTKNPVPDARPSFSPDGKQILFDSLRAGSVNNRDVFIMNSDGTGQTPLTTDPEEDTNAAFSPPAGNKIAFVSRRGDPQGNFDGDIFTMSADGGGQTRLTDNAFEENDPSFSPDGNKIAFASNRAGQGDFEDFDIFVMGSDGSSPNALTFVRAKDNQPAFSPDGQKISFVSTRDGGDEDVFVMEASGANQTDITPNLNSDFAPDWQPVAATITVNTAADPGDGACSVFSCTLREAINASNGVPGRLRNTIKFNIPGGGVQTITPESALPAITRPVIIDGYTQPGASANTKAVGNDAVLKVELNGTNVSGSNGLTIQGTSGDIVIKGLVINRFDTGVAIEGDTVGNRIEGNFIGTDPTGTIDRGNLFDAVALFDGPSANVIGGTPPAARNVLSGNDDTGIFIGQANGNTVQGNYVGTDKSGTKALGNTDDGIALRDNSGNTIGGAAAGAGNLISGNPSVGLDIASSNETKVLGNLIGTTANGTGSLGNNSQGVFVQGANNLVGDGTAAGSNTIAFNGADGVEIGGGVALVATVSRNSIFSNATIGIDLLGGFEDANGVTANDPGDVDAGSNGLQNKPVLSSAKKSSTKTTITGKLNSTPGKTFKIEFFSNPSGDEGKKFLGQRSVTTDGSGATGTFTFSPATAVAAGQTVTATATDPAGNTSEFSTPRTVTLAHAAPLVPETTKLSGPSGVTRSPSAHFKFDSPDPEANFECSLDGGEYYECSSPENIKGLSSGTHAFEVRARDGEGDVDASPATWRWVVDRKK